jgi:hypothetical protein
MQINAENKSIRTQNSARKLPTVNLRQTDRQIAKRFSTVYSGSLAFIRSGAPAAHDVSCKSELAERTMEKSAENEKNSNSTNRRIAVGLALEKNTGVFVWLYHYNPILAHFLQLYYAGGLCLKNFQAPCC